jgi:cytosolic carboxypeptidase protein 6
MLSNVIEKSLRIFPILFFPISGAKECFVGLRRLRFRRLGLHNRGLHHIGFTALLFSAATFAVQAPDEPALVCEFDGVVIDIDFEAGNIESCHKSKNNNLILGVSPEKTPINMSPWYAFRIRAESPRTLKVVLKYSEHSHRYKPKISADGVAWAELDASKIKLIRKNTMASLTLDVGPEPLWVAGQEIIDNNFYRIWMQALGQRDGLQHTLLGKSAQGRDIGLLRTVPGEQRKAVLFVGRQHPPEVTGALAMQAFMNRVFAADELATSFRNTFAVLMVPNLNPDGVAQGHWRFNTGGLDLNRDWGPFTQPETQLMRDLLLDFQRPESARLSLFLDFHSTYEDVFYTQPDAIPISMPAFTETWLTNIEKRIQRKLPGFKINRDAAHNPGLPTSKTYVYTTFGIPAITFELGDNTDRRFIRVYATIAAEEMMSLLLTEA